MSLHLKLFGASAACTRDGEPVHLPPKPLALLTYLALEAGRHRRDALTALLWTDAPDAAARTSLRQAVHRLREVLGDAVDADRDTVALTDAVASDVDAFSRATTADVDGAAACDPSTFLEGLSIPHAEGFEEWVDETRRRLCRLQVDALRTATQRAARRSHWTDAARWAGAWLARDPLDEAAARALIEARFMGGDRTTALREFRTFRENLRHELGQAPSSALEQYVQRIERDEMRAANGPPSGDPAHAATVVLDGPICGREREWERLTGLWTAAAAGRGGIALIEGETGAGKTRLLHDFLAWTTAQGATVLRGRGYGLDAGVPYAAVADALRGALTAPGLSGAAPEWLGEASRLLPDARQRFPHLPPVTNEAESDRRWRLFEGVAQVILALAAERPTVIALDDIQASDADSCALLHFLSRRLETQNVLILLTLTLGELDRASAAGRLCRAVRADRRTTVISLAPLTEDAIHELIHDRGRLETADGGRRLAARIRHVTDGNPFHVVELLKAMFDQGLLTVDAASGEWMTTPALDAASYEAVELPRTVRAAIEDRCARLAYELRDLLATVAVSRRGARADLLSHVHGISRLRAAALADALVDRRLLDQEEGVYRCAHPVVEQVVRAGLTPARRAELDRAIALALDHLPHADDGVPGDIASHAARGGERDLAFRAAVAASDAALGRFAFDEALAWLDLASDAAVNAEASREANARTARVLELAGGVTPTPRSLRRSTPRLGVRPRDVDLERSDRSTRTDAGA
ncbi:MAG TPA: AAA family ATPase [Gemmatimonadales bacterium]|nr:AAA family ATPase [Gemmatimonadales bacterium]